MFIINAGIVRQQYFTSFRGGCEGVDPLVGTNGKEKSINRLPNRTMETHTLKFDSRRPAPAGQHFPPTGQKSWWGDCHRTSINHIGLSSIYYNSGGRKMDTVKNKNSSLTLDDGMPRVCGRPAGRQEFFLFSLFIRPSAGFIWRVRKNVFDLFRM
jgi:hypothetical protein